MNNMIIDFFQWEDKTDAAFRLGMLVIASLSICTLTLVVIDIFV